MASLPKVWTCRFTGSLVLSTNGSSGLEVGRCGWCPTAQLLRIKMTGGILFASPRPSILFFPFNICPPHVERSAFAGAELADDQADHEEEDRAAEDHDQVGHALAVAHLAGEAFDELGADAHDGVEHDEAAEADDQGGEEGERAHGGGE